MKCREGCGACCIAPSISSAIPGMPEGKPVGIRCIQLDYQNKCKLFESPQRPRVCISLKPSEEMCGSSQSEAIIYFDMLEEMTK